MMGKRKTKQNIRPHLKQHILPSLLPLDQRGLQGFRGKSEVVGHWDFNCRPEEIITWIALSQECH